MVCYPSSVRMHTGWRRGKNLWSYDPGPGWLPQRFLVENGKSVFPGNWLLIYRCFGAHLQIFVTKMGDFPFHLVHLIHELTVFLNEALPLVCELNRWKIRTLTKSYWKMRVRFQSSKRGFGSYKEPLREAELNTAESQDMVRMRVRVVDLRLRMRRSKESGSKRDGGRQLRSFGSIPGGEDALDQPPNHETIGTSCQMHRMGIVLPTPTTTKSSSLREGGFEGTLEQRSQSQNNLITIPRPI